jgi:hypothetical protein
MTVVRKYYYYYSNFVLAFDYREVQYINRQIGKYVSALIYQSNYFILFTTDDLRPTVHQRFFSFHNF